VGSIKVDESAPAAADVDDDEKKDNDSTSGVATMPPVASS